MCGKLTEIGVKRLQAPEKGRLEVWDTLLPGFGVRVTPSGQRSFEVMYRIGGVQRQTLGTYPALSLADARKVARKTFAQVAEGRDPSAEKRERREGGKADSFQAVAAEFVERYAKRFKRERSWRENERLIGRELLPKWGKRRILDDGKVYSHHASDPLSDGHAHDAFDLFMILEHEGDTRAAIKAAGGNSGTNHHDDKHGEVADATGGATGTEPGLTDLGNAHRFARDHGPDVRYCWPWGRWLVWNGRYWCRDETGEIHRLAEATIRLMYEEAARSSPERREALGKWAVKCESHERRTKMLASAQAIAGIPIQPKDMDLDVWLLNVLNGTIDLRTGTLRAHAREDYITRCMDVSYDPDAKCPTWESFIHEVFGGDAELVSFVQKAVGYSLTGVIVEHASSATRARLERENNPERRPARSAGTLCSTRTPRPIDGAPRRTSSHRVSRATRGPPINVL